MRIAFHEEHTGHHHGQDDLVLYAYDDDTPEKVVLGYVQYVVFKGIAYVSYILVHPPYRRRGVGRALVAEMERTNEDVNWGMLTDEGVALLKAAGIFRK